ncbi:MAG: VWA domain-containing protein [Ardenticatenales bacterium]|nr:VWA domain-containing protein [Ardenticatenales bacterium]
MSGASGRVGFALSLAAALSLCATVGLAPTPPGRAVHRLGPGDFTFASEIPIPDGEPVALAVAPDGSAVIAVAPTVAQPAAFPALRFVDAAGTITASRVPRDSQGRELLPLAVASLPDGLLVIATADQLVGYDAGGGVRFDRPAGDGHPDFGPSARGLAATGDRVYGVDIANARLVGYDAASGILRQRLGTAGMGPGSFLAPLDVDVLADGRRVVADFGNRRLAFFDGDGNPVARWPLPERPVAVAHTADDGVVALLADDTVFTLDSRGAPIARFGGFGPGAGELRMASDMAVGPDGRVWVADRGNRRVAIFAPGGAGATATAGSPPPTSMPTTLRGVVDVAACPGEPARLALAVELPSVAPRTDVVLVFDTTGSMEAVVSTARARAIELAARLRDLAPDVAVAVVDVRDVPYGAAGQATDWPWRLRGALSTEPADLAVAAGELWAGGGGDEPEAYAAALRGVIDDPRMGWRAGARKVIALFGDSVPRDEDLNAGVVGGFVPGIWSPGLPVRWRDSGPDMAPYSADDLDWQSVLPDLADAGITLVVGVTGTAPAGVRGRPDRLTAYWRDWALRTAPGGGAMEVGAASELPAALTSLVGSTGRQVRRLAGDVEPVVLAPWVMWSPREHLDLAVPPEGIERAFDVTVAPPPLTPDGTYDLTLHALADGARYASQPVRLSWRSVCGPTATPDVEPTPTDGATEVPTALPTDTPGTPIATTTATASATTIAWPSASPTGRPVPSTATATTAHRRVRLFLPIAERFYCDPARRPVVQVVLAIDTSSSMAGDKLAAATEAGRSFIDLIHLPRDQAAVVAFDNAARVVQPLTASRARLRSGLTGLTTGVGTRIDLGIGTALDVLEAAVRPGVRQIVVLLTDGRPDGGSEADVLAAAARARVEAVSVFAVGLGEDAAGELLARVATDTSLYRFAPSAGELGTVYREIAGDVGCR